MQSDKSVNTIRILLVDGSSIFRRALTLLIELQENLIIDDEAATVEDLFKYLQKKKPTLVIVNSLNIHESVGNICKRMNEEYPQIPLLVFCPGDYDYSITTCIKKGVHGVILKDSKPDDLIVAINKVAAGERYINIRETNLSALQRKDNETDNQFKIISDREYSVLKLFSEGLTYKEIGEKLNISPRTVESHKNNLLTKYNFRSLQEMISFAVKHKLI